MKQVKGQPITAAKPQWSKKAPLVPNAKDTSADAQKIVKSAPTPFKNNQTTVNLPTAGSGASGGISTLEPRIASGLERSNAPVNPSGAAIGQSRMPNQSKQIGGRSGVASSPRRVGDNSKGYPSKRNASFYGE